MNIRHTVSLLCVFTTVLRLPAAEMIGSIDRLDPALDRLIPRGAVIEKLADGFGWAEGPVWMKEGKHLLFSDVPGNTVHKWKEGEGAAVFLRPSGTDTAEGRQGANGLTVDAAGRLLLCEHGTRRISRLDGQTRTTIVNNYQGKKFNSPNDLVFRSNGDLYCENGFGTIHPVNLLVGRQRPRACTLVGLESIAPFGRAEEVDFPPEYCRHSIN